MRFVRDIFRKGLRWFICGQMGILACKLLIILKIQEDAMAKILIVDDMASMRKMVAFTLENAGHEAIQADDGDVALEIAKTQSGFALVITDVNMPNMDGITLTSELRKLPALKFTPILLLTTEAGRDKKMEGKAAGATGWLVKPFDPDKLLMTIKKVLR